MPPARKCSKEEILNAAFELAREQGLNSVVARSVGARLNTSSSPIFTVFSSMDELKAEIGEMANKYFMDYVSDVFDYTPAFKEYGLRWVQFAIDEPELYKLLFNYSPLDDSIYKILNDSLKNTLKPLLEGIQKDFGLNRKNAEELFNQMVIHAHGIASYCLCVKNAFTKKQVDKSLSLVCKSLVISMRMKEGYFSKEEAEGILSFDDTVRKIKK